MPKIITREFDNSTTGITLAPSFGVVVPGFSAKYPNLEAALSGASPAPYDENGVIELSSTAQFDAYVGKFNRAYKLTDIKAQAPTDINLSTIGLDTALISIQSTTPNTVFTFGTAIYSKPGTESEAEPTVVGYDVSSIFESIVVADADDFNQKILAGTIIYIKPSTIDNAKSFANYSVATTYSASVKSRYVTSKLDNIFKANTLYTATAEEGNVGHLHSETYAFAPITFVNTIASLADGATYAVLNFEGADLEPGVEFNTEHVGNQMAYMLLQLGYPVLFKLLDRPTRGNFKDNRGNVVASAHDQLATSTFWKPLKDKTVYDFRYLTHGGDYTAVVADEMSGVAEVDSKQIDLYNYGTTIDTLGRGDVIALVDVNEDIFNTIKLVDNITPQEKTIYQFAIAAGQIRGGKNTAIFAPKIIYNLSDSAVAEFGKNKTFPASFHYLACAAYAQEYFAEWYAVAGYERGISTYDIAGATYKLGSVAVNSLSPRKEQVIGKSVYYGSGTTAEDIVVKKAINIVRYNRGSYHI